VTQRHVWTRRQEQYLENLYRSWHDQFQAKPKFKRNPKDCPVDHKHAWKRGYCLISERQWTIAFFRSSFGIFQWELSDRAIWTKYGRVNGLRENGKVKRTTYQHDLSDSYQSPSSSINLVSGFASNDDRRSWTKWLESAGCTFLGEGISRSVFDLNDGNVVKIEHNAGAFANRQEIDLWERVRGTEYEQYFAPIVAADFQSGRWIVMKKADMHDTYESNDFINDVHPAISQFGLYDIHTGNVGSINGSPVIIDYAA
jgi:hypothetical protein